MLKTSVIALGIVLASGGSALAQSSSPDAGPPKPPPKPTGHHHRPTPPGGPAALQGKGFELQLGHGRGLRVQCGDEPFKNCVQATQPLIQALSKSVRHPPGGIMSGMQGSAVTGSGMMKKPGSMSGGAMPNSSTGKGQSQSQPAPSDSSGDHNQM